MLDFEDSAYYNLNVSRSETEMNMNWASANPELFVLAVEKFQKNHPSEFWDHKIDLSRDRYVTLIAIRKN